MESEASPKSVVLELSLASWVVDDRNFGKLELVCRRCSIGSLSPACDGAVSSSSKNFVRFRKTNWRDIDLSWEWILPLQDGDIVVKSTRVVVRIGDDL